mmetsp:Transcript_9267/g.16360  ORF Transcript_9267/g.16360 Transcript_9267/m.16360 type:complete len:92 (-) Transcript_9267:2502-2777(-)
MTRFDTSMLSSNLLPQTVGMPSLSCMDNKPIGQCEPPDTISYYFLGRVLESLSVFSAVLDGSMLQNLKFGTKDLHRMFCFWSVHPCSQQGK